MPTYRLNASGQYLNDAGESLYRQYKAPLGQTGGTGDFYDAAGQGLYGGGRVMSPSRSGAQLSPLQRLSKQFQEQMNAANAANEKRYLSGLNLLGLDAEGNLPAADPTKPAANSLSYIPYAGASGQTTGKTAGRFAMETSDADALARGIYNTSTALNNRAVSGGVAARESANRTADLVYRQKQTDAENARQQLGMQLGWLEGRDDVAPSYDDLIRLAELEGMGNLEGLVDASGMAGGGGGWAGNEGAAALGYGLGGLLNFLGPGFGGAVPAATSRRTGGPSLGQLRNAKKKGQTYAASQRAKNQRLVDSGYDLSSIA